MPPLTAGSFLQPIPKAATSPMWPINGDVPVRRSVLDPALKLYCCRHTFATDALERTGNLAALMKALGHADAQTAMKYQHPGLEQIRIAVDERNREHAELARFQESPHSPEHAQ